MQTIIKIKGIKMNMQKNIQEKDVQNNIITWCEFKT